MKKRMVRLMALGLIVCMTASPMMCVHAQEMETAVVELAEEAGTETTIEEEEQVEEAVEEKTEAEDTTPAAEEAEVSETPETEETGAEPEEETVEATVDAKTGLLDSADADNTSAEAVVQTADEVTHPQAPTVTGTKVKVVKDDAEEYKMFVADPETTTFVKTGDSIEVTLSTKSVSYNGIYLGYNTDETKDPMIAGTSFGEGGWQFTFKVPASKAGTAQPVVLYNKKGTWYEKQQLWLYVPSLEGQKDPVPPADPEKPGDDQKQPEDPVKEETSLADGSYTTTAETGAAMFKVVAVKLNVNQGKTTALVTLSGVGYDYLYMGSKEDAGKADQKDWIKYCSEVEYVNEEGVTKTGRQYEIPVAALDTAILVASRSEKKGQWYDRTITFSSANVKEVLTPVPADGTYKTTAETGAKMFRVVDNSIKIKDGKMTAVITLSGVAYDYLYMGSKEDAEKDENGWIKYIDEVEYTDPESGAVKTGKRYEIPVCALDKPIALASHSQNNGKWYDREIVFSAADMKPIADENGKTPDPSVIPGKPEDPVKPGTKPGKEEAGKEDKKPDEESKYQVDRKGSTSRVNNSTGLADGVYKPDRFSWSGGTGKVQISCSKITVKGGQAYATITFDSSYYQYVKANGNTYYTTKGAGSASAVIPVELNKNNQIIGMTTRMSTSHEIQYSIFIYLAAANAGANGANGGSGMLSVQDSDKLSEKAPEIIGLSYRDEIKLENAELFKLFEYDNGVKLLEIDTKKYTAEDPEYVAELAAEGIKMEAPAEQKEEAEEEKKADAETEENEENQDLPLEERIAALYQQDVVRYLLVPEGAEIPAGLDKEMIVVQLPLQNVYAATDSEVKKLQDLQLQDLMKTTGMEEADTALPDLAKALKEKKTTFAGAYTEPDFKVFVKEETDAALFPGRIIPGAGLRQDINAKAEKKDDEKALTLEEQQERMDEIMLRMATLGIPVIIDRSEDEKEDLAKAEWIKLYGALFEKQSEADALYQAVVDEQK